MKIVTSKIVDEVWEHVNKLPPETLKIVVPRTILSQPELTGFLRAETASLERGAVHLAFTLFAMIVRMFEQSAGGDLPPVSAARAEAVKIRLDRELLHGYREKGRTRFIRRLGRSQPHVVGFMFHALTLPSDDEDDLLDDTTLELLAALGAVVLALDEALNRGGAPG